MFPNAGNTQCIDKVVGGLWGVVQKVLMGSFNSRLYSVIH